jgi:hypothetical protein
MMMDVSKIKIFGAGRAREITINVYGGGVPLDSIEAAVNALARVLPQEVSIAAYTHSGEQVAFSIGSAT